MRSVATAYTISRRDPMTCPRSSSSSLPPRVPSRSVPSAADQLHIDFRLAPVPLELSAVTVTSTPPVIVDTRTGDQIFNETDYHGAPTNTTSQILQQSIAGAARAPTGEVHIRGQHAEYTYYVDGVPVPAGSREVSTRSSIPQVVNQINFPDRWMGRGVRQQECGHREHHHAHSRRRNSIWTWARTVVSSTTARQPGAAHRTAKA